MTLHYRTAVDLSLSMVILFLLGGVSATGKRNVLRGSLLCRPLIRHRVSAGRAATGAPAARGAPW